MVRVGTLAVLLAMMVGCQVVREEERAVAPRATEDRVADAIAALGDRAREDAAVDELMSLGWEALPALRRALGDRREEVRSGAAAAIRRIVGEGGGPESESLAVWMHRMSEVQRLFLEPSAVFAYSPLDGPRADPITIKSTGSGRPSVRHVLSVVLPELTAVERELRRESFEFNGGPFGWPTTTAVYRLDEWTTISLASRDGPATAVCGWPVWDFKAPIVALPLVPEGYTGLWTTWYINGQRHSLTVYRNGEVRRVLTCARMGLNGLGRRALFDLLSRQGEIGLTEGEKPHFQLKN